LAEGLTHVAHEAIRNRGTLGGSLALADPSAELPACAICLDAHIVTASIRGERRIAAEDFFKGLYATDLAPDELIVRIEIPVPDPQWHFCFDEVARRHGDFAIAGIAAALHAPDGRIDDARIVFFGVEASPRRARSVEAALIGHSLIGADAPANAGATLASEFAPLASVEYPAAYRLHLARVLLARALARLFGGPA
jgi:carbon-monoxide dehydrogenase medium subunit